ncbi:hypothetical protein EI94DRAFT_392545 [Lactarius quietus]|nr:hypothetical protein EI94DRAFT_392545 [Lactarius quietus]
MYTSARHEKVLDIPRSWLRRISAALENVITSDSEVSCRVRRSKLDILCNLVQVCPTLQELRLFEMSFKKVPQSVQNFRTLMGFDLQDSSDRIGDIADTSLYRLRNLQELKVQNNRMERLSSYFHGSPTGTLHL